MIIIEDEAIFCKLIPVLLPSMPPITKTINMLRLEIEIVGSSKTVCAIGHIMEYSKRYLYADVSTPHHQSFREFRVCRPCLRRHLRTSDDDSLKEVLLFGVLPEMITDMILRILKFRAWNGSVPHKKIKGGVEWTKTRKYL